MNARASSSKYGPAGKNGLAQLLLNLKNPPELPPFRQKTWDKVEVPLIKGWFILWAIASAIIILYAVRVIPSTWVNVPAESIVRTLESVTPTIDPDKTDKVEEE